MDNLKINSMIIFGKFSDGKIHQIVTTPSEQLMICKLLSESSNTHHIVIDENPIDIFDWEATYNLTDLVS